MRPRPIVAACVLAAASLVLAALLIDGELDPQESIFNTQAQTVLSGRTPLFFHAGGELWLQPVPVYSNAALQAVSIGPASGRIASAIAGAADVALVVLAGYAIAGTAWAGIAAGLVLMLTPGHWSLAVHGTDPIVPAPLILLWLYFLLQFLKFDSARALALSAIALGATVYAHPSGPLTAIFLWMLTVIVSRRRHRVRLLTATLLFIAMWLPAAAWFYAHRDTYADTFGRWLILASHLRSPLDAFHAFVNPNTLGTRASLYWGFWDPSDLFFATGDVPSPMLLFEAPLILAALLRARQIPDRAAVIIAAAALVVPIAGSTFGVPHYFPYAAAVLPLMALLAGLGFDQLVALLTRRHTLEDEVAVAAVDGWDAEDLAPRG